MEKSVKFTKQTRSIGRNGVIKTYAINITKYTGQFYGVDYYIELCPITSKGNIARCSIAVPTDHAEELIKAIMEVCNIEGKIGSDWREFEESSIKWSTEDFDAVIEDQELPYTMNEDQKWDALTDMIHHHDCNIGITWDTLAYYVVEYGTEIK